MNAGESSGPRKILIRGVNWLGDAVMSLPAVQRLREARPNDSITVLTGDKLFELWAGHSPADEVIQFRRDENVLKLARGLRGKRYDIAVIFPNSFRSVLEVFLARIPVRIGYGGNLRGPMLTTVVRRRQNALTMRKRSAAEVRELIAGGKADPMLYGREGHHLYHYLQLVRE